MASYLRKYGHDWSKTNWSDILNNVGSNLKMISFKGGFHGRTMGTLSLTRSNPEHKVSFPAFPWLMAPFPELKYPLEHNED